MLSGPPLLFVFFGAIVFLLLLIIRFKVNAFLALLVTSILTAFAVGMRVDEVGGAVTEGFGNTLRGIGIVIGLGIVLGQILVESGATDQIANRLLRATGVQRADLAMNGTGVLVSIPVFFDAAFVIFTPLARRIQRLTGRPWVTYVTALSVGLLATHAMVIPTPGPLAVAANMDADIGFFLLYSLVAAVPAALAGGFVYGRWIGRFRDADSASQEVAPSPMAAQSAVPSGGLSIAVLLLPVLMILVGSVFGLLVPESSWAAAALAFVGDKNIALLLGVFVALFALRRFISKPAGDIVNEAAAQSGLILLITGAGGSFGHVISASGIGSYLVDTMSAWNISLLVLGFLLAAILRVAQGSTTVALITTSAILGPAVGAAGASSVLVGLAIGAGGMCGSLPNDSGFWVVSRFADLTVRETMKTWTAGGTLAGFFAFLIVLALSLFRGVLPGL